MAYKELETDNLSEIDSVSSFISQVKSLREAADGVSAELYFRGQETEFWDIEPSIFRDDMLSIEHKLMQIPLQKSPVEFREFNSMFDIMTKYQHYGMCTRLLDLTTNPLVALYFACKSHGKELYDTEDGTIEKEPDGVVYYTDKYYPSQSSDEEIKIVSALASYDLTKENTLSEILEKLRYDHIIDNNTEEYWLQKEGFKNFVKIIQSNYMVMPTYTNERLRKQSGVFLLVSLFSFDESIDIPNSIIFKSKGKLKSEFNKSYFYVKGENKEAILKELDLYNINEATLFPELEHQLNYIRYANRDQVRTVPDFIKYERKIVPKVTNVYLDKNEINNYIISNLQEILSEVVNETDIKEIAAILKNNFSIDWYKRDNILSKMRMSIATYYSSTGSSKIKSKRKAMQIIDLISKSVEKFISLTSESGD